MEEYKLALLVRSSP
jgi:hypothetical protein